MDINTYLTTLSKSLIVSKDENEKIKASFEYLKQKLWGHFQGKLQSVDLFGSFDRNTMLPRRIDEASDVDTLIVLKSGELEPQTYLNWFKEFAEKNYQRSDIYQDHPTIALELNHIRFELVPGFYNESFWSGTELKIPAPKSTEQKWITTSPNSFKEQLLEKDSKENGMILPLIRLIKYWNTLQGRPFSSYYLEEFTIGRRFPCSNLKEYFFELISDLGEQDFESKMLNTQTHALMEKRRRLLHLEKGNMYEYFEQEMETFLPKI